MTSDILPATTQGTDEKRGLALMKAVGLDKVAIEQRELALHIADRYELDLLLKHLVLIDGRAYITRDGLLHVAHRSGVFDGIEVTAPVKVDAYWRSTCTVWRKDMSRGFTYHGRYPATGGNAKYNEEMAVKVAEVAALRRAFDVSAPTLEEKWEGDVVEAPSAPKPATLAELARQKRETIETPAQDAPESPADVIVVSEPTPPAASAAEPRPCGVASIYGPDSAPCSQAAGHAGHHRNGDRESWE